MKKVIMFGIILGLIIIYFILDYLSLIPKKYYDDKDFNIVSYQSLIDKDNDGIDDANDIYLSAKEYVAKKPKYKSKYYQNGYPDDEYGVCTDVVGFALLGAGYDIKELLYQDVLANRSSYNIEVVDKNIDFRRVNNLKVYLDHKAIKLTNDIYDIASWQAGDIVVFKKHIGIVSKRRNKKGITYVIHNAGQIIYEEDILKHYEVIGHYRIS